MLKIFNKIFILFIILLFQACVATEVKHQNQNISEEKIASPPQTTVAKPKINETQFTNKIINCPFKESTPKPSWVDILPEDEQYIYGIGIAPEQGTLYKQRRSADIIAKNEVALQIKVYINSEFKTITDINKTDASWVIEESTKSMLYSCKIIERWYNVETCEVYSLARAKKVKNSGK